MTRILTIFSLVALTLLTQGCKSTPVHKQIGFPANYDNLVQSDEFPNVLIYTAQDFDKSQLNKAVNKVL